MRIRTLFLFLTLSSSVACDPGSDQEQDGRDDDFMSGGKSDDTGGIAEDSPEARAILVAANSDTSAHMTALPPMGIGLAEDTAEAILAFRAGADGKAGTMDDKEFETLAELDAIDFTGPVAFEALVAYTTPTALRVTSVSLKDPHVFAKVFFVCTDITGQLNDRFADSLVDDESPKDGLVDLSVAAVFRPFDQLAVATASEVGVADCSMPASSTKCAQTDPIVPSVALNQTGGICLDALPGTTGNYDPAIVKTHGPCLSTEPTTLSLPVAGLTITLHDAQVAAKYWNGILADGMIRGFVTEEDANTTLLPADLPVVGGKPLAKVLAGGAGSCSNKNDKDVHNGVSGWWFYLNFAATPVPLVTLRDPDVTGSDLRALFPSAAEIPSQFEIPPGPRVAPFLIDGELVPFEGDAAPVMSPIAIRDGDSLRPIQLGVEAQLGEREALAAVHSAARAWGEGSGTWPAMSVAQRIAHLDRFAAELEQRVEVIASLLMYEIGKPLAAARKEVIRSVEYIRDTNALLARMAAGWDERITATAGTTTHHALERRAALGIVLCVAPFNYPINEFLTTVAPALVMGNVVIAKTPRFGVLASMALSELFARAFPPGAISMLPGDGRAVLPSIVGARRADGRGHIDMLAFIGSEGAAHAILSAHPTPATLHKVLGLGAKNAAIVLPGANLEVAAARLVPGALGFNGQRCTAEKILHVSFDDARPFTEAVTAGVASLAVGMPWTPGAAITPLPEPGKAERMAALIEDAIARGARVLNDGGGDACGSLMRPAVVYPVDPTMRLFHEEQFGPIVPIAPYSDVAQVLGWQRESPYGQQVGLWGPPGAAAEVAKDMVRLVARVNLNDVCQRGPDSFGFTATDKSGSGVLSLRDALLTFSRPVLIQSPDPAELAPLG